MTTRYDVYRRSAGNTGWTRYRSIAESKKFPDPKAEAMKSARELLGMVTPMDHHEVRIEKVTREVVWRERTRRQGELV